jgi:hypothetical protein
MLPMVRFMKGELSAGEADDGVRGYFVLVLAPDGARVGRWDFGDVYDTVFLHRRSAGCKDW